jgi:CRP-like cAMP-binding protein
VIDQFRQQIQRRLDEVVSEADRLRQALAALDPRGRRPRESAPRRRGAEAARPRAAEATAVAGTATAGTSTPNRRSATARRSTATTAGAATATRATRSRARQASASAAGRAPSGSTKAAVLGALKRREAMTAGQVAETTGLGRASVSTTLSKLSKSGEVQKAKRGYRLAAPR